MYLPLFFHSLLCLTYSTLLLWISRILYENTPAGVSTSTVSPTLWPISALPTGLSLEILPFAVRLGGTYDLVIQLFAVFDIQDLDLAADVDLIQIYFILDYDFCVLQDLLQLFDTGFDVSLLILRCIVLSVLGQVSLSLLLPLIF